MRPDHFGPSRCASEVTTTTVNAEAAARAARSTGDVGTRRSAAVSGRRHTRMLAMAHTAAANGMTPARPIGIAANTLAATTKLAAPRSVPAAIDAERGAATNRVAAR